MPLSITISNIQLLTKTVKNHIGQEIEEPLVRFAWNLLDDDKSVLVSEFGWLLGADRKVSSPKCFSFGRRRVKIHEVSGKYFDSLRRYLLTVPDVVQHLGPEEKPAGKEVAVEGPQGEVKL